jgi:transposase
VKGADTVARESRGYDAGKKVNGRKRFIVTDTLGLRVLNRLTDHRRRTRHIFADAGFAGRRVDWAAEILRMTVEVVRKAEGQRGFSALPRRWAVERTLAWITAHRRLARDYERHPANSEAMIRWAVINTMIRRVTRGHPATRPGRRHLEYLA